jgi:hypothetical protein
MDALAIFDRVMTVVALVLVSALGYTAYLYG